MQAPLNNMLQSSQELFNDKNCIFSTVHIYRKRVLSIKISYCRCELLPFCAISFVCYTQCYQLLKCSLAASNDYDRYRNNVQDKLATPEASVHPVKNCLCYLFAIYPINIKVVHRYVQEG